MEELLKKQQKIMFSGYGASHQNGEAYCSIKTVVTMTRTMLMHAALRFPEDTLSTDIWPMAMDYSVWFYNQIPDMMSGLSAIEIWSRSRFEIVSETLRDCHVWGCTTYVLEPKFRNYGVKIPKWDTRSRRGVNMGFSNMHSTQVGLVLNLLNGSISPPVQCCI